MLVQIPGTVSSDDKGRASDLLGEYARLLLEYNQMVNLISRKSTADDVQRHIEHSLCLAKKRFVKDSTVVDWGSGGGLPAIPLAIVFPNIRIIAVDTIGKKTKAIDHFIAELGLQNVAAWNGRAEEFDESYHYSVSRATAKLARLWSWHAGNVVRLSTEPGDGVWKQGLLTLKGGDLSNEISDMKRSFKHVRVECDPIAMLGGVEVSDKFIVTAYQKAR